MEINLNTERWEPVPGYPNYEASTMGRIRNIKRGKFLTLVPKPHLYLKVILCRKGYPGTQLYVHQVIAMTFIPGYDRTLDKMVVDHINEDRQDNRIVNLQFITAEENSRLSVERKKRKKELELMRLQGVA